MRLWSININPLWLLLCVLVTAAAMGQAPPQQFTAQFTNGVNVVAVDFERYSIRSANFNVVVHTNAGAFVPYTAKESATYLGTPVGISGAVACATRKADGTLLARVFFEDGVMWSSTGTMSGGNTSIRGDTNWARQFPTFTIGAGAGANQYAAELGVDVSWAHFNRTGLNVDESITMVEHSVLCANVVYLREAGIVHRIGRVVIRSEQATDPYEGLSGGGVLLPEMRNQWNNVLPASTHDIAAMVTTGFVGGGLAYVGVIGTANRYSVNDSDADGDFSVIWRHEAGHNWSANHFEGNTPEGATVMSGNGLGRFSSPELSKVVTHRNTKLGILDNLGPLAFPLPPRASMEVAVAATGSAVTIDVLANDSDGNGDSISILSFDPKSHLGGTVTRSVGTGPGGRDQLQVQMVADHGQPDWFQYRIVDATGRTATSIVYLQGQRPSTKLSGTIIGTTGSYQNNAATRKEAALDGNLSTFYDAANVSGDWVGLDLGEGSNLALTQVKFAARPGFDGRMNGGMFQASNVPDFSSGVVTLFTINSSPPSDVLTSQPLDNTTVYRYVRYLGPDNGSCNVAELEFWGAAPAAPNAPNGLLAAGVRSGEISLGWNPAFDTASYNIKRASVMGGPYNVVATGVTSTNYSDVGLTEGAIYYYVVSSVNALGESANSLEASAVASAVASGDWRFDDGSGTVATDSSTFKNHGTVNGAAWTTGILGGALQFNGSSSWVTLGTGPSVSGTNSFTVSAWVKTTATTSGVIIQQRDAGGFNGQYRLSMNSNGTLQFMVYGNSAFQFDFATTAKVNDGVWHHVVAVRDGLDGRIYIDGSPTPAATATGSAVRTLAASISVAVGRDVRDNNANFNGTIDEVRIYKTLALTGGEVQGLYNKYITPVQPQITSQALLANGTFTLSGIGGNNQKYVLRTATTLEGPIAWTSVQTNTANASGAFSFTDAEAANFSRQFYQVTSP